MPLLHRDDSGELPRTTNTRQAFGDCSELIDWSSCERHLNAIDMEIMFIHINYELAISGLNFPNVQYSQSSCGSSWK